MQLKCNNNILAAVFIDGFHTNQILSHALYFPQDYTW